MQEIWINARFLTHQISGVERFAIEICRELIAINPNIKFIAPSNIVQQDIAKEFNVITCGKRKGPLWEQLDLPKFLKKLDSPLLLNLCNSAPIFYNNNIVTIHDLAFLENPKWFSFYFRTWYKNMIPQIVKKAKHVFTISKFSKKELQEKLNVPASKMTIIYNGLSSELIDYKNQNEAPQTRTKTILSVGSINPRKNITALINAFNLLDLKDYELLIAGASHANFGKEKFELKNNKVKFLGYVTDEELWELYQKVGLFVFPSLYEGFGIPILEALYFDCPTIVGDLDVYKEVYNNFEVAYTNGHQSEDYAQAIKKKLDKNVKNNPLSEKVLAQCSYQESALKINEHLKKDWV